VSACVQVRYVRVCVVGGPGPLVDSRQNLNGGPRDRRGFVVVFTTAEGICPHTYLCVANARSRFADSCAYAARFTCAGVIIINNVEKLMRMPYSEGEDLSNIEIRSVRPSARRSPRARVLMGVRV
jgi:hypothetical protein